MYSDNVYKLCTKQRQSVDLTSGNFLLKMILELSRDRANYLYKYLALCSCSSRFVTNNIIMMKIMLDDDIVTTIIIKI